MPSTATNSSQNIYSFGMVMFGRSYSAAMGYRFGFNGKEEVNEIGGIGNCIDFGARVYESRICRFLSLDPALNISHDISPYTFAGNQPIWAIDKEGAVKIYFQYIDENNKVTSSLVYDHITAEEIKGGFEKTVTVTIHTAYILVDGFVTSGTQSRWVSTSVNTKTEGTPRDEEYDAGLEVGLAYDFVTKFTPFGQMTQAAVGKDFSTGADLATYERFSKVIDGIISFADAENNKGAVSIITHTFKDAMIDKAIDKMCEASGYQNQDAFKLTYAIYKLVKEDKNFTQKDINNVVQAVKNGKDVGDVINNLCDMYKQDLHVDFNTVKDAVNSAKSSDKMPESLNNYVKHPKLKGQEKEADVYDHK